MRKPLTVAARGGDRPEAPSTCCCLSAGPLTPDNQETTTDADGDASIALTRHGRAALNTYTDALRDLLGGL